MEMMTGWDPKNNAACSDRIGFYLFAPHTAHRSATEWDERQTNSAFPGGSMKSNNDMAQHPKRSREMHSHLENQTSKAGERCFPLSPGNMLRICFYPMPRLSRRGGPDTWILQKKNLWRSHKPGQPAWDFPTCFALVTMREPQGSPTLWFGQRTV